MNHGMMNSQYTQKKILSFLHQWNRNTYMLVQHMFDLIFLNIHQSKLGHWDRIYSSNKYYNQSNTVLHYMDLNMMNRNYHLIYNNHGMMNSQYTQK